MSPTTAAILDHYAQPVTPTNTPWVELRRRSTPRTLEDVLRPYSLTHERVA